MQFTNVHFVLALILPLALARVGMATDSYISGHLCVVGCGDDNREDINGDGRVQSNDISIVYTKAPSNSVVKPSGH